MKIRASHILDETKEQAENLLLDIKEGVSFEDLAKLESLGFKVFELDLGVYSTGLSKIFCTFFDDEIVELNEISLLELFNDADSISFRRVNTPECPPESIKYTKERFYNKFIPSTSMGWIISF